MTDELIRTRSGHLVTASEITKAALAVDDELSSREMMAQLDVAKRLEALEADAASWAAIKKWAIGVIGAAFLSLGAGIAAIYAQGKAQGRAEERFEELARSFIRFRDEMEALLPRRLVVPPIQITPGDPP